MPAFQHVEKTRTLQLGGEGVRASTKESPACCHMPGLASIVTRVQRFR